MVFAELKYQSHYSDMHDELLEWIKAHFSAVESGHQGDSWIWVKQDGNKVEIDTFYSMKHQVKSASQNPLVDQVLLVLSARFPMTIFQPAKAGPNE